MPIYEYRCSSCSHELEALQKFSDAPLAVCPACGKSALVKLVSAAGFQLKGSGWYATDFKGSGSKPAAKTGGGEAKGADSKSDAKSESKSESKSDAGTETKSDAKTETKSAAPTAASGSGTASS